MERNNGPLSSASQHLGTRIREMRAARRMSQASLAAAMASRGFPWHQQTVAKVENGKQRAEFDEVIALSGIFGVELGSFIPPEAAAS